jgi:hypothetical protein
VPETDLRTLGLSRAIAATYGGRWTPMDVARAYRVPPWLIGLRGYEPESSAMRTAYRRRQLARRRRNRR